MLLPLVLSIEPPFIVKVPEAPRAAVLFIANVPADKVTPPVLVFVELKTVVAALFAPFTVINPEPLITPDSVSDCDAAGASVIALVPKETELERVIADAPVVSV